MRKNLDFYVGGLLVVLLFFPVRLVGKLLRRKHDLSHTQHVTFVKMLGGGSLFMLYPTIYELKKQKKNLKISLLCSRQIKGFAEAFGWFDEIHVIDDSSLIQLLVTSVQNLWWLFQNVDTSIDLEVHSRLTTVFTTISCVKNRIGFIDHNSLWRRRLYTHAIYVNPFRGIFDYYDSVVSLFSINKIDVLQSQNELRHILQSVEITEKQKQQISGQFIAIGVGCSDLAFERQLPIEQWQNIINGILSRSQDRKIIFLGGHADGQIVEEIKKQLSHPNLVVNLCGLLSLKQSMSVLLQADLFMGIDSALIHFARYLKVPSISFWGPTSPLGLLRPLVFRELQLDNRVACSPCVHLTQIPPCRGQNFCMKHSHRVGEIISFISGHHPGDGKQAHLRKVDAWIFDPHNERPYRHEIEVYYH